MALLFRVYYGVDQRLFLRLIQKCVLLIVIKSYIKYKNRVLLLLLS